nr:MAG TPA: hypothetical protein [Caudoviricetes sp.]
MRFNPSKFNTLKGWELYERGEPCQNNTLTYEPPKNT